MKAIGSLPGFVSPRGSYCASVTRVFRVISLFTWLLAVPGLATGQTFIQQNGNTVAANAASVSVTYTDPQTPGNLNIVVVGWNDTSSSVISVVDDNGNTYVLAGTSAGLGVTQAIYYARNISTSNTTTPTVTVTFNQNAGTPDVRILEYSGLSASAPLDNWTGSVGNSTAADSGATTTSTSDLILGAGTTANGFTAPGAGFTLRVITTPFGDIVEDTNTAQPAGTYSATATLGSGAWVMQVVGFSTTGVNYLDPPVISPTTPITPAAGADTGGTTVTINGTNFQPGAVVLFGTAPGGISGLNCTESGGTAITCQTPAALADGGVDVTVVNVDGQLSSAVSAYTFQNITPTITSIAPTTGPTNGGTAVTVTGSNFQAGTQLKIGGLPAGDLVVVDDTTITGNSPGLPAGAADVTVRNSNGSTATLAGGYTYALGTGPINYIQRGGAVTSSTTATVQGLIPNLQQAGNLNVVIIGWADAVATISSVTDTEGNTYVAALPPNTFAGLSQVIYYAKNILGDSSTPNQITVTFSQAAVAPDVRILEYSGLDITSPIDTAAGATGSGILADSGACTTTVGPDLIVAGATVETGIAGAGTGYALLDITANGDNSQHQIVSVPGSCQATASMSSGNWVMQSVAFKAAPAPAPDFSVSVLPASQTVVAGSPAAYTVTVSALNGFNSAVTLTCDALTLPTGASCTFVPSSVTPGASAATSDLTITTSAVTPVGTAAVTVTGTSGSVSHDTPAGLTVNAAPDYSIASSALTPASVVAGGSATATITITALNGFTGQVDLSCSVTPVVASAPTCAFVPASVTGGSGTSALTVSTSTASPVGAYTITVESSSGALNHTTPLALTVTAIPDFTIAASTLTPASLAASGSATSTITITPANGFNSAVGLTCTVTPVVSSPPTCAFVPASVASGSGTSGLTVNTVAGTPTGAYTITVAGNSGALNHTTPLALTVTAAPVPDFTIAASTLTPAAVNAGGTATSTITIAPTNGFNSTVNLTCAVTPAVTRPVTCALSPLLVTNGSGTSTLTVRTVAATTASVRPVSRGFFYAMLFPIGGLALLGTGITTRKKKLYGFLLGCMLFSGLIFMSACGGSSSGGGGGGHPGTPAGTYTITITGTAASGSPAHPATVTLTVQ